MSAPSDDPAGRSCLMRLAAIDLGTNTVHLLVADVVQPSPPSAQRWRPVHHDQVVTRLGEGLWPAGVLRESPMARTAGQVALYVEQARALGATRVRIVATSAVREATNGRKFAEALSARTGVALEIADGDEEARLTVLGVLDGLGSPRGPVTIFDIGGGSTEYIVALDGVVTASVSLRLGVVRLTERFPFPGTVDSKRFHALESSVLDQLRSELPARIVSAPAVPLIGTAGTVTALAALDLDLRAYAPDRVQGHRLTRAAVERQRDRLGALTLAERGRLPCLEPARADIIVPGIAIVLATMTILRATDLIVSDAGLREGVMSDSVARIAADLGYPEDR